MENRIFCQSCSMPLDNEEIIGTEKDGSKCHDYCIYCYSEGAFTNPDMRMGDMIAVVRDQMDKMNLPRETIYRTIQHLADLKRWRTEVHMY